MVIIMLEDDKELREEVITELRKMINQVTNIDHTEAWVYITPRFPVNFLNTIDLGVWEFFVDYEEETIYAVHLMQPC